MSYACNRNGHAPPERYRLQALRRLAEELGALRDPRITNFFALLERDPARHGLARLLEIALVEYAERQRLAPNWLAPPPTAEDLYDPHHLPDFPVGVTTETNLIYGPRFLTACGSTVVTGIPGGGKTTLIQNMLVRMRAAAPQAAVLVFDVKGDYTCLGVLPGNAIHIHALRNELRLGVVQPPSGTDLEHWLPLFATYVCEYRGLKKSRHVLLDILKRLCRHFGVDRDPTRPWPSLVNVRDYLRQLPGGRFSKDGEYRASLLNELSGILDDAGTIFDTADGIDLETHLLTPGSLVVLGMATLPVPAQQLIISLCVERLVQRRIATNVHNVPLQVLVVLDEAQLVLGVKADRESSAGIAPLAHQLLRAREMGVAFFVVAHLLSDISRAVLTSATTTFVVGGLGDAVNIDLAVRTMNLDPRARTMLPRLGRGQALVREMGTGAAYTDAFLVNLDPPELDKSALDEPTRQQIMTPRRAHCPATSSRPLTDYPAIMAELFPATKAARQAAQTTATTQASAGQPVAGSSNRLPLNQSELDLLMDCARHRDSWMNERSARLTIPDYKTILAAAQRLAGQGFVALHDLRLGRTSYALMEVTDPGWKLLALPKPPHYIGHGSFVHTVLISRLGRSLAQKHWTNVQAECRVGAQGHPVDLFAVSPAGIATAFEVTLSHSNVVSNARQTLSQPSAVRELIFLCPLNKDCRTVQGLLSTAPALQPFMPRIQVRRIDEFLT